MCWEVITAIGTVTVGLAAIYIGFQQNSINRLALKLNNFIDVYVYPVHFVEGKGKKARVRCKLHVQNKGSQPIYLNRYCINGQQVVVGRIVLPFNPDPETFFVIQLDESYKQLKEISLELEFEDYQGKKWKSVQYAEFKDSYWTIIRADRIIRVK